MSKIPNESLLLKKAIVVGENYAKNRGYKDFGATDSQKDKVECLYRLLVHDNLVQPLPEDKESGPNMRHKLAIWISRQLPKDHPLLR